ncbi:MAG: TIR domain-containing protein, partial [Ardenticatenaceae bacterium]
MSMARRNNPYIAGAPLRDAKRFFGREEKLRWVERELGNAHTNALVLFGQRRIGKTSVLLQLRQSLPQDAFLPVYFDLQDQATRPLGEVLADLADTIAEEAELSEPDLEAFDDQGRFFRRTFLPQLEQDVGSQRRLVLLLDEFDVLDQVAAEELADNVAANAFFPFLRRLMSEHPWLAFVFISGRRSEDLSLDFTATFKTSLVRELWTLDHQSAQKLIRQAERNGTLKFTDEAVARLLSLTNGHPYLTQLLCQRLWERAYDDHPATPPLVDSPEVEQIIPDAFEKGEQALIWLWDGLGHVERIYAAALAQIATENRAIADERIVQVLADHAARLRWRTREVVLASRDLVKRRVLEEAEEGGYRFSIELFRRWVHTHKPLREVKEELDRIDPEAEQLFKIGLQAFRRQEWQRASRYFEDALSKNDQHFRARLRRGESLLELGRVDEAVVELERAYELDKAEARFIFIEGLLRQAEVSHHAGQEQKALRACQRVLRIAPHEQRAQALRTAILKERGEYDVFLSYATSDQGAVERLARRLEEEGLRPFFDQWYLIPGEPWEDTRQQALRQSRSCALLIGPSGWQAGQLWPTIEARAESDRWRVIPVLLPGAPRDALDALPTWLADTAWVEFGSHLDEETPFYRLVAGIKGILPKEALEEAFESVNPYRGLQVFEEVHAPFFFGRDATIEQMLQHLKEHRFLAVLGASGSGKSSLVRAGLLPALRRGQLAGSDQWSLHVFKPGSEPLERLAMTLKQAATLKDQDLPELIKALKRTRRQLHLMTQRTLSNAQAQQRLVLVVDQFEELFTLCRDESQRQAFIANLLYASGNQRGRTIIVVTMRADFYAKCANYPDLAARISQHQLLLGPMSTQELRQAIERPVKLVGLAFEKGLVERLLADVQREPGALPLLAHALFELWRRREGRHLTLAAYEEIGGVQGAIASRAEEIYAAFQPTQQTITQNIILRLTQPGEGTEDTRRRVTLTELLPAQGDVAEVETTIQTLADARLLTTNQERDHQIVDVAHEALIRRWPRLQNWLDKERTALRIHRRLTLAATDWHENQHDKAYLYQGARLIDAQDWAEQNGAAMNLLEQTFLNASQAAQRRITRFRFGSIAAIIMLVLLALAVNLQSVRQLAQQEREAAATATRLVATAVAAEEEAQKQQAIAESLTLAAKAQPLLREEPQLAVLLGVEAVRKTSSIPFVTEEAGLALYNALAVHPHRVITLQQGHIDSLTHAAWSSDNRRILTASRDGDVRVWNAISREERLTLSGHSDSLTHAAWSHDSSRILTASSDHSAKVWDAASAEVLLTLSGHSDSVTHAAWSFDSSRILTASSDHSAKVWDADSGEELLTLSGHESTVNHAAWSFDSSRILTASADKSAKVWDADSGFELLTLSGHSASINHAAWSGDSSRIVTASWDNSAKVWDADSAEELLTLDRVNHAAWSDDDNRILTASDDRTAKVWDAASGEELLTLSGHDVIHAAWSPDGGRILTASNDRTAKVSDAASGEELLTLSGHSSYVTHAAWSLDGGRILTTSADQSAKVWDAASGEELLALSGHSSYVNHAAWSGDESRILTASRDHTAKVWDAASGALLLTLSGHSDDVNHAAWSPDGGRILTASWDHTAKVWNAGSGEELLTLSGHSFAVTHAAWSPDGGRILTVSRDHTAKVWDAASGKELSTLSGHSFGVNHAAWSPDGGRILTASYGSPKVWDAASAEVLLTLRGHSDSVNHAAWSPDGGRILAASYRSAKVWDAASGEKLLTLSGHSHSVPHAAWSPDGGRILTASRDGSAKVWGAASEEEVLTLRGHSDSAHHAAWSPDGGRILTASNDGTAKVWDAARAEELLTLRGHTDDVTHAAWSPDGDRILTASA